MSTSSEMPETDAFRAELERVHTAVHPEPFGYGKGDVDECLRFASKLERERNEARNLHRYSCEKTHAGRIGSCVYCERDEAISLVNLRTDEVEGLIGINKELRTRVAELEKALGTAVGLIVRHHEVGVKQEWGCFCPVCHHKDGSEPELDAIKASLKMPSR